MRCDPEKGWRRKGAAIAVALLAALAGAGAAEAAPPGPSEQQLDQDFGEGGLVSADLPGGGRTYAVAMQRRKILAGGFAEPNGDDDLAVARFRPGGRLNRGFGDGGILLTDRGGEERALALASDGRRIVAGGSSDGSPAILRYRRRGRLDRRFADRGTMVRPLAGGPYSVVDVELLASGKVLAAVGSIAPGSDLIVMRLRRSGRLDRDFARNGVKRIDLGGTEITAGVAGWRHGKVLVAGATDALGAGGGDFALARLRRNGHLDRRFGNRGGVTIADLGHSEVAAALATRGHRRIAIAGTTDTDRIGVAVFRGGGRLLRRFGGQGVRVFGLWPGGDDEAAGLAYAGRKLLVAGNSEKTSGGGGIVGSDRRVGLARFRPDGSLDPGFGADGVALVQAGTGGRVSDLAVQPDRKAVLAGYGPLDDVLLLRFDP